MAIDLITGHQGQAHISAEQISDINNALMDGYGSNKVLRLDGGTLTQDGLEIDVAVGYWRANGFDMEITEAETVYIDPSSVGTSRIDNIYIEILQDIPTGVQRSEIVVVQGEEDASPTPPSDPTDPELNTDLLLQVVKIGYTTVTEGAMVLTDQTEDFDIVTPSELATVDAKADIALSEVPWYATSDTAQSTAAKEATTAQSGFSLVTGAKVIVKFDYTNTEAAPTLNVNSTGAKSIVGYGTTVPSLWWLGGDVVEFTYDGTNWIMQPTQGQITTLNSNLTTWTSLYYNDNLSVPIGTNLSTGITYDDIKDYKYIVLSYSISSQGHTIFIPKPKLEEMYNTGSVILDTYNSNYVNGTYYTVQITIRFTNGTLVVRPNNVGYTGWLLEFLSIDAS